MAHIAPGLVNGNYILSLSTLQIFQKTWTLQQALLHHLVTQRVGLPLAAQHAWQILVDDASNSGQGESQLDGNRTLGPWIWAVDEPFEVPDVGFLMYKTKALAPRSFRRLNIALLLP